MRRALLAARERLIREINEAPTSREAKPLIDELQRVEAYLAYARYLGVAS